MLLAIFPAKEARKSSSKLRRKFAANFAANFANFTLQVAGAYIATTADTFMLRNQASYHQDRRARAKGFACLFLLGLTFFRADFGKEFPSRTLWRGPSRNCPSPSSALCPLLYRTHPFAQGIKGAKMCREKGRTRGGQQRGPKGKKDA